MEAYPHPQRTLTPQCTLTPNPLSHEGRGGFSHAEGTGIQIFSHKGRGGLLLGSISPMKGEGTRLAPSTLYLNSYPVGVVSHASRASD